MTIYRHEGRDYNMAKLPKWAQEAFQGQEYTIKHLRRELEKKIEVETATRITVNSGPLDDRILYIPDNSHVRFDIKGSRYTEFIDVSFDDHETNKISVYGWSTLVMQPRSSNIITVGLAGF